MKRILATLLALTLVLALALPALAEEEQDMRPRIIITTDGEYDDQCSFLRLIMYSDVIDIDGLIYSAAECHWKGDGEHTQKEIVPHFKGCLLYTSLYCTQGGSRINPLPRTMNSPLFTPHLEFTQNLGLTRAPGSWEPSPMATPP